MNNFISFLESKKSGSINDDCKIVTYVNPFSYLIMRDNIKIYSEFDYVDIDGGLLVFFLSVLGVDVKRKSFDMTSMAETVFERSSNNCSNVFFWGTTQESIVKFTSKIKFQYPKMNVVGFSDGYRDRSEVIDLINFLEVDLVIVGMGAPLQEKALLELRESGWKGQGYTCGGFFHQTASSKSFNYYPDIVNRLKIRWVYRMFDEPNLMKRYFLYYPKFFVVFLKDIFTYLFRGDKN